MAYGFIFRISRRNEYFPVAISRRAMDAGVPVISLNNIKKPVWVVICLIFVRRSFMEEDHGSLTAAPDSFGWNNFCWNRIIGSASG